MSGARRFVNVLESTYVTGCELWELKLLWTRHNSKFNLIDILLHVITSGSFLVKISLNVASQWPTVISNMTVILFEVKWVPSSYLACSYLPKSTCSWNDDLFQHPMDRLIHSWCVKGPSWRFSVCPLRWRITWRCCLSFSVSALIPHTGFTLRAGKTQLLSLVQHLKS